MAFHEVRFPTKISYGASGGPQFNTDIIELFSGFEKRNQNWANSKARYDVSHNIKTQTEVDELIKFFRARKGRAHGFRFRDWADYKLVGETIGTGDGAATTFQIKKTYTNGVGSEVRDIKKIVSNSDAISIATGQTNGVYTAWAVYKNSVLQTETTHYTVDRDTGIITFLSAPANGHAIQVDGEFDVPVRFDTDKLATKIDYYNDFSWGEIPLVEVRI